MNSRRGPEDSSPPPSWRHHHATKMRLTAVGINNDFLLIQGSAAEVRIARTALGWSVRWRIKQSKGEGVSGRVIFSKECLQRAFGLDDQPFQFGGSIAKQFNATTGYQGAFIRQGIYLNIPGPGTGHDGDPNVSLDLDEKITAAVKGLLFEGKLY